MKKLTLSCSHSSSYLEWKRGHSSKKPTKVRKSSWSQQKYFI